MRSAERRSEVGRGVLEHARPCFAGDQRSMSMKRSAGLQDSGTEAESHAGNIEADLALAKLINQPENTDWSAVPVTSAEGDTWTARLIEVQEIMAEGF